MKSRVILVFLFLLPGMALAKEPNYRHQAAVGVKALQAWYSPQTGIWEKPSGWWNAANSLTVLINYEKISGNSSYYSVISNTFIKASASQGHRDFINQYYDDSGWWALAWIDAYDLTGNPKYLAQAQKIFSFLTGGWDDICGGGLYWTTARKGKNAIPNELFLEVAAKLANRTTGSLSASYLNWALKEWKWFDHSGMINSMNLVNDGLNQECRNNGGIEWTYNQGVILGGLVELSRADHDPALLKKSASIADSAIEHLTDSCGILIEHSIHGGDAPQFKGIFVRNLMELNAAAPANRYRDFFDVNAESILKNDQSNGHKFGALWQGPFDAADVTRQAAALDALIAAMAIHPHRGFMFGSKRRRPM